MYVSIDREGLRALHIHPVPGIVHDLVYLECANVDNVVVADTSSDLFLEQFTDMELKMLYRNVTGGDASMWSALSIRHALAITLAGVSPVRVNQEELALQCDYATEHVEQGRRTFKYAYGSKIPAEMQELFPLTAQPMPAWHDSTQAGTQRKATPPAAVVPANREPGATRPPAGPRAPRGNARPTINRVADEMWEKAGKPMDKAVVLELRKEMMTVLLDEHGIPKTNSSTALGDWMKTRLA